MAIKHSTTAHPNDIVASADWNASHVIGANTIKSYQIDINADLPFNNNKITGLKNPTLDQDAATKKYVDDAVPPVGTYYWSCPGSDFLQVEAIAPQFTHEGVTGILWNEDIVEYVVKGVNLPNGAVITEVVVYGTDATDIWILRRQLINTPNIGTAMANAVLGTADNTITNPTIDNNSYRYWFDVECTDRVYGARIKYTL